MCIRDSYQSLAGFPQSQIGNAPGNYVYNAPWMVASAGITLGEATGWFGDLRWRYISSRPVSYTHLDVYKRQRFVLLAAAL